MQHSEPFENEALMSEDDHIKLQKLAKGMLVGMLLIPISLMIVLAS